MQCEESVKEMVVCARRKVRRAAVTGQVEAGEDVTLGQLLHHRLKAPRIVQQPVNS
jgi:hypothetical protein